MQVFITGGTGCVGANLVAAFNTRGIKPWVLRRPSSTLLALEGLSYEPLLGDVLDDPASLAEQMRGVDWVFHVAAVSDYWRSSKDRLYRINVEGTKRVLAAVEQVRVERFVYTSSLAAMGLPQPGELLTEESPFNVSGQDFSYAHSKILAEQAVQEAVARGLPAVIVNPAVTMGPRDVNQIAGAIVMDVASGLIRRLRFTAPGGVNYIHVSDVAEGHIGAAERGRIGERYILGAHNISHTEAIETIADMLGTPKPLYTVPARILPAAAQVVRGARRVLGNRVPADETQIRILADQIFCDSSKAVRELGLPQTPFAQTVLDTITWYRSNGYLAGI